ncbi:glutathione S-transferase family protein [Ramlibacter sp.]|uniref:glutathione S-transferase family protein n=1 Tax=Ramlibacter sp. TaxID=1917967 RepID=UPI00184866CE|nr:glutathione S-transferase family protein [Ramlibacter sp.]MBA2672805.1 glutathione S-transferase family protein [Ramlibacter sp.]
MRARTLYYAPSGNSLRAAIAAELAGLPVEKIRLDVAAGDHRTPAFLELNASGTVPAYLERLPSGEELVLTQSAAIADHLLLPARPDLYPDDPIERVRVQSSVYAAMSDLAMQNSLMRYLAFSPDSVQFLRERFLRMLAASFEGLKTQPWVCGPRMTIADIAHYPVVHMRGAQLEAMGGFSHVLDWAARMRELEAVRRAAAYAGLALSAQGT